VTRPAPARDDGVTLVELLVVMALLPIVLAVSSAALINAMRMQQRAQQTTDAQNTNRAGLELVTRLLRQGTFPTNGTSATSTIITEAGPSRIVFTSRLAGGSTVNQYVIALVGTNLQWSQVGPTCPASGVCTYATPTPNRTVVAGVRNATTTDCSRGTSDGAVFHYYSLNPIDGSLSSTALDQPISGSSALGSIAVVRVDLFTRTQLGGDTPTNCERIQGYVDLRNAR
jgi:prepilin-type N-terminal cleavage/methylation domain-containing protein